MEVSTPGRICLFGEHQDYLGLPVIAMAVSLRAKIIGEKRLDQKVIIHMPDIERTERFDLNDTEYQKERDYFKSGIRVCKKEGLSFSSGFECEIKSDIVSEDENENELRMILNFGHTVGHAIESFTDYKNLLHGEAIFYGMKCALYLSNKFGSLSSEEYDISTRLISKFELPKLDINNRKIFINFVKNDKKFREKKIRFILLDEIGKSRISEDITFDQIEESLGVL